MHRILFQLGGFPIYSYGFMLALAVTTSLILLLRTAKREGFDEEPILDITIIAVISGLIGSRLFYVFFYEWDYYRQNLLAILDFRNEGLVFYGAIVGGALAVVFYMQYKHLRFWNMADLFAPYLALGEAIGRIGCFLNGCCYGHPTTLPWGMVFPGIELPRHPTQLYSTILGLALFAFLVWFYRRRRFDGQVFLVWAMGYALLRFMVEFFRENLMVWPGITFGQATALTVAVIAAFAYRYLYSKHKHPML